MKTKSSKKKDNKDFEELEEQNEDLTSEEDEDSVLDVNKPEKVDYKSVIADDSVKMYLQQIGKIPLLSYDEEMAVAREIKENNSQKAKETLIS